jgi:putative peptidoglycan lipid II flippase
MKLSMASGSATFISRISGFIRDIVTANLFGATIGYDAFVLAFRIPNLMRRLFAEGAFSQAFVPVFAEYTQQKNPEEIKSFINKIAGNLTLVLIIFTACGVLLAPWLIKIAAPGFSKNFLQSPEKFATAVRMLQIVFPYILFISLTALAAGILNCYHQFLVPAFTPVLLNFSLIACSLLLAKKITPPELSLAWGVLVAGILQLAFQLPFLHKLKLLPRLTINWQDAGVKRILLLMIPAILGAAISQINILIDSVFASFLATGSISWLYYADRLMEFPLGVFGVSFATVILPQLSRSFANKNYQQFNNTLAWGIKCALLIGIPSSLILLLLAEPIVSTLFLTGKFTNYDVVMSSQALMAYAFSVLGIMLAKIFSSGFYATGDLKTPVKIGLFVLLANVIFNTILTKYLQHVGIALATSIVSIMHAVILYCLLIKKGIFKLSKSSSFSLELLFSISALTIFLYFYPGSMSNWLIWPIKYKILKLTEILCLSAIVYCSTLWACGFRLKNILVGGC